MLPACMPFAGVPTSPAFDSSSWARRSIQPGGREEEYYNCHTSGELAYHLVKQMPNLEELYLLAHRVDASKIFPLPLPNLRIFQLYHSNSYPLDKLAANKSLTSLTTLLCHPHAREYDDEGRERTSGFPISARSAARRI